MVKTADLNKSQALDLLREVFNQFQHWIEQPQDPKISEVEKLLSPDFQFVTNGSIEYQSPSDYLNRLAKLRKTYARIEIEGPFEEPLVSDNRIAFDYAFNFTKHNGEKSQSIMMAIVTIENHKFKRWVRVTHETGKNWVV